MSVSLVSVSLVSVLLVSVSLVPSDSYAVGKLGNLGILGIVGMRSCVSPRCRYSALCFAL